MFFSGEIIVNEVNFVRKCIVGTDSSQSDLWGRLICTNFKVSFIPQEPPPKQVFVQTFFFFFAAIKFCLYMKSLAAFLRLLQSNVELDLVFMSDVYF